MTSYERLLDGLMDSEKTSVSNYFDFRDYVNRTSRLPKEQITKDMLKQHYAFEQEMKIKCVANDK